MRLLKFFLLLALIVHLLFSQNNQIPNLSFKLMDGSTINVQQLLKGGPLLIDFWALWCAPCLKSMRYFDEFHRKFEESGFHVLMVNLDSERNLSKVRGYIHSRGYHFLVALDSNKDTYRQLNVNMIPYMLLVDTQGRIVYKHTGYIPGDERFLEIEIISLLKERSFSTLS